jgi:hypothetical protein
MIRPRYSLKLARTKLRSKRGMLAASVVVSSLLFAVLVAGIIIFTGAEKSAISFLEKANNNRYLVEATPVIPVEKVQFSQDLSLNEIQEIRTFEKKYYDDLRVKYEKLGIQYDKTIEIPALTPAAWKPKSLPEEQRVQINYQSPVIIEMQKIKYTDFAKNAKNKLNDLKAIGSRYGADGYYPIKPTGLPTIPGLRLIQNQKENFDERDLKTGNSTTYGYFTNAVHNGMYVFEDDQLLGRYMLSASKEKLKGIPVIISAQEAASLFGQNSLGKEPESNTKKASWLANVQEKMNGYTYQACYRNSAEQVMFDKIQQDYAEMTNNKNNKEYKKPSLIYDYPNSPCGAIVTTQDTRTVTEKKVDQTNIDNQKKLGTYIQPQPHHQALTFQIVGVINAQPNTKYDTNIESFVKNLVTVENKTSSVIIPNHLYEALPAEQRFDSLITPIDMPMGMSEDFATHILEFKTINEARRFINQEACPGLETNCKKLFTADPYGSNYLILEEIGKFFRGALVYSLPIILGLAIIIIWFTMARVMTENRKETAVYRAMGAKRRDIAAIYLTYSAIVALCIVIVALVLGALVAWVIDYAYTSTLTNVAVASFGIITNDLRFTLFDLSSPLLLLVPLVVFFIVLTAVLQPLVRNVRRNPINDMRSE